MTRYTASCLCADVQVTASSPPRRIGACHCKDCQKHHGAAFYAAAFFDQSDVVIAGETNGFADRHFCPRCGSSIFARSDDEIEIQLGALDTPVDGPSYELWTDNRADWLPAMPGAKQFKRVT